VKDLDKGNSGYPIPTNNNKTAGTVGANNFKIGEAFEGSRELSMSWADVETLLCLYGL